MEQNRKQRFIGIAMIGLGIIQAVWGALNDDFVFAGFGAIYALIGTFSLWYDTLVLVQYAPLIE